MKKFQITSRPRHLRYVFFIDGQYSYEKLFKLICSNQKIWGGRHNPIIPVNENVISEKYIALLKYYDPDYIFYTKGIDPEIIKRLRIFNPCGYYNLDDDRRREDITGVDAFYLLSQFDTNSKIILSKGLWETKSILLDFYKLCFGIEADSWGSEIEIGKNYRQIILDINNFGSVNKILHKEKPIINAGLSRSNLNTKILRQREYAHYGDLEIVVAKDKTSITDLFYYWNRLLYEGSIIIYVTVEELNLLSADNFFGNVLYDLSNKGTIRVVSMTLRKEEIDELITLKLNPIAFYSVFQYKDIQGFPFEILDDSGLFEVNYGESWTSQTLISKKGLFYIPKLSFTNKIEFHAQKYAIDIEITKGGETFHNQIEFPLTTQASYIVKNVNCRINLRRHLTVIIHNQKNTSDTLEIQIPEFKYLLNQLICHPVIQGEAQRTKFVDIGLHDASNKLSAFIKSFNYEFSTIDYFFTDKFWVDIFKDLITNDRVAGDSIFFDEIKFKSIEAMKNKGIEFGKKGETQNNLENLELGLKETIKELCSYRVFLKGFKLKCSKCSSEFWYHLNDVNETVRCNGCLEYFELPIEPKFAYKINDLIKNNIFQSKTQPDGNLTVIRTLVHIYNNSRQSFFYSPQINLYDSSESKKPCTDIDIICLSDGRLIIGEAKHRSTAFSDESNKCLKSLVEIAKSIHPDKIILSCYEDPNGKLEKAKKGLLRSFNNWEYQPEIETLLLEQPNDFNLGGSRYFYY